MNKISMFAVYKKLGNYFKLVPLIGTNLNLIEPNLYLGSRPTVDDIDLLQKYNITHILTCEEMPLPEEMGKTGNFTMKCIMLEDEPTEDLLRRLEDCYSFISEGLSKGTVLVHCFGGISRSASVVIGFIMKKHQLTYDEAFNRVQQGRYNIDPNPGFVSQLKMYRKMGYEVDSMNIDYKIFKIKKVALYVRRIHAVLQENTNIIEDDPELEELGMKSKAYCCKKCKRILVKGSNLIPHEHEGEICAKSYFVMPVAWMKVTNSIDSELHCPRCKSNVGWFNWIGGIECQCGAKQVPGFYLKPSEVDFVAPSK
ncbi:dual specificity protein phosphatase MPK-4-like isoform X1 [Zophobas morio]|uniref:dual specificity protein phosphatase MPK-4-like isoform X1 n=1 Tax=Zophobas morio TaxID=2755281 RepID=UPI003082AA0B